MSAPGPMRRSSAAVAALSALALSGCATAPVQLGRASLARDPSEGLDGEAEVAPPAARARPGAPAVWIGPVEDRRADTSLGAIAGRPFGSAELSGWVDGELAALASPAFLVVKERSGAPRLALHPRILKAYLSGFDVTKTAVIVLEVEFVTPDGKVSSRVFRGQDTGVNWATSEGEVITALRTALAACLEQLRADLEARLGPAGRSA